MSVIDYINGVDADEITKFDGVSRASIDTVDTIDWPEVPVELTIPDNLIILYPGGAGGAPAGWEMYTAANNYNIIGAGDTYDVDDHGAGNGAQTKSIGTNANHSPGTANFGRVSGATSSSAAGSHSHNTSISYTPPYQNCYLIRATAAAEKFPANSAILSHAGDLSGGALANIYTGGRLLRAAAAVTTGGSDSVTGASNTSAGAHTHGTGMGGTCAGGGKYRTSGSQGAHTHTPSITMTNNLYKYKLSAWRNSADEFDNYAGVIAMWEDLDNIPDGWYLCNGANGTPNLRNKFIKLVGAGSEGSQGNGTVNASATTSHGAGTGRHNHILDSGSGTVSGKTCNTASYAGLHGDTNPGDHSMDTDYAWLPPYYALGFIMYGG